MPVSRQLAAIMFSDIVGYTALMGKDETKAFDTLRQNRLLQKPLIEAFHGTWIKELGDGVLASFTTVTDAVSCARSIQEKRSREHDFQLRIGIHLGEVVFENNDVFGDGVNIASRIQAIAPPGEIYFSEPVYHNISNKAGIHARFVRQAALKNVKEEVKLYHIYDPDSSEPPPVIPESKPASKLKSVAILPLLNLSNDKEQEYFCDGVSEEITDALTHIDSLRVISRMSTFALKGKGLSAKELGETLNVDSLLEGSVRKAGNRLRITTKLVSVADETNLWSERYDHELEDIFTIQEDIARSVASALKVVLSKSEKDSLRRPETDVDAYKHYLKGKQLFHLLELAGSKKHFEQSIRIDPGYALSYAGLAYVHTWFYEWEGAHAKDLEKAETYSQKALLLAPELSESHVARAYVLASGGQFNKAVKEFNRAIELNPNAFEAYYFYGRASFAQGQVKESADLFIKAGEVRQEDYQSFLLAGQSLRIIGDKEAGKYSKLGIQRARRQLEINPKDKRALSLGAGILFELGHKKEAFEWVEKAFDLYPTDIEVIVNSTCLYAKDGQVEKALDRLELATVEGFGKRDWIEQDSDYDILREEPRFKELMSRMA